MKRGASHQPDLFSVHSRLLSTGLAIQMVWAVCPTDVLSADPIKVDVQTEIGIRTITLPQAGPEGDLITPTAPEPTPFRPPSIFSAPLPSGSGARALGLAGAFTALADDATAASWNPAGLTQLESPEVSAMYRYGQERDKHHSDDQNFRVGENEIENQHLNYLSLVKPLYIEAWQRNVVLSLNYQEAFDFSREFSANLANQAKRPTQDSQQSTDTLSDTETQIETVASGSTKIATTINVKKNVTTRTMTNIDQLIRSDVFTSLNFSQEGVIDALTPAFAIDITPRLSIGASFNYYNAGFFLDREIRSKTRATFSGTSDSFSTIATTRETSGTFTYDGESLFTIVGLTFTNQLAGGGGDLPTIVTNESTTQNTQLAFDGLFEEQTSLENVRGYNATLGLLWTASRHLSIGASIDLPWTARADQRRVTRNEVTTFNQDRSRVLDLTKSVAKEEKGIEMTFPLYWALGLIWRWSPQIYTTLDISQTRWSEFSFKANGEPRINPLSGKPKSEDALDDTWSIRMGSEVLIVFDKFEIPIRVGGAWEQRPAIGNPDDYVSFSLGSGVALGKNPGRALIDFAYVATLADGISSIVPDRPDLSTDIVENQFFISYIQHF